MAISRHAVSPAGDRIEIVSDDDWMALTGCAERSIRSWNQGGKRFIIAELWRNGIIEDLKSGRATGMLWKRMQATFPGEITTMPTSFPGFANDPLNAPALELVKKGKRTYSIKLIALPQFWYDKLEHDESERAKARRAAERAAEKADREAAELVAASIMPESTSLNGTNVSDIEHDAEFDDIMRDMQLDAPTVYDIEPPLEIAMASQVAMSLLTTVVEIISAGTGAQVDEKVRSLQGDLNDALSKLSARLEDNDRMRRQLRQAGDEIQALRYERDGLRSRLRATEANLTAALKGDAVQAINGEIMRRVDSIMRVAPTTGKGTD
jgi:regulator of replication initiation timing